VSLIVGNEKRETVEEGKAGERMEVGREEGKRSARREKCSSSLFSPFSSEIFHVSVIRRKQILS